MVEIEKPRIECIENPGEEFHGKYVVEPLERGYGTTLGNSMRRILLSSLPGTAVTSIKIAGVQHEFSTIPGVKEDVTEIVLNVKGIIAKLYSEGAKTVYIEASGEGEVTAGDIKADGEVEILNPELHIATLGPDASLNMELMLSHGRGYVPADRNKPQQAIIGVIPVDSVYTPVKKVNYTVENTRVGDATDFDKLTLEVWTNGVISARDAVSLGAKILCDHFTLFTDLSDTAVPFDQKKKLFRFPNNFGQVRSVVFASIGKAYSVTVDNRGGFAAGIVIRIRFSGEVKNPRVKNLTTGKFIGMNRTFQRGEQLELSTVPRNKHMKLWGADGAEENVIKYRDFRSSFGTQLIPGSNRLALDCDDLDQRGNMDVTIYYTPLYLEVE